jgi:hypothetical protein
MKIYEIRRLVEDVPLFRGGVGRKLREICEEINLTLDSLISFTIETLH